MLIDILYNTQGRIIYSEISKESPELLFIEELLRIEKPMEHTMSINNAFNMCFPHRTPDPHSQTYFTTFPIPEAKLLIHNSVVPSNGFVFYKRFADSFSNTLPDFLLAVAKISDAKAQNKNVVKIMQSDVEAVLIEFLIVINLSAKDSVNITNSTVDQRMSQLIHDPLVIVVRVVIAF
jgi:hypothetical protein